jgi:hypothetical protein
MHDHPRLEIVDPEVVVIAVAQRAESPFRLILGCRRVHASRGGFGAVEVEHTPGRLHQVYGLLALGAV